MNHTIILIGSNINPEINVFDAISLIQKKHKILHESKFMYTNPVGFAKQPDFLNGMAFIATHMDKDEFEQWLNETEAKLGRQRTQIKPGPRTIDLNLVTWNDKFVYADKKIMQERFFRKMLFELLPKTEKVAGFEVELANNL
ncbi:MAG TPA: 2-amino-4-hydroxy-6-hydroxymethyldihydropteridine diphosphokinase [archaeon]|nr:2-amino-4-hydroxy-6-hydroxymethyldihydropteridine diphosphokinase [archaeon]